MTDWYYVHPPNTRTHTHTYTDTHMKIVVWIQQSLSSSQSYESGSSFIAHCSLLSLSTRGLIQNTLKLMKYFCIESQTAQGTVPPPPFCFGTGETREEKRGRGRRDEVKFVGKAMSLVQASCSDDCSDQACESTCELPNIYCII